MRRKIHHLKYAFIGGAVALTLVLFLWPTDKSNMVEFSAKRSVSAKGQELIDQKKTALEGTKGSVTETAMQGPRFSGETKAGDQWLVEADTAVANVDGTLKLNSVYAEAFVGQSRSIQIVSNNGTFDRAENGVTLNDGIVATGRGYTFESSHLRMRFDDDSISSHKPVRVTNGGNYIHAGQFDMRNNGNLIIFKKGVKAHFLVSN